MNGRVHNPQLQIQSVPPSLAPAVSLQSSAEPIQVASSLVVPYLLPTDDPLECFNKVLTFMSTILALSYPSSNNQLETSSNLMHQVAMPERQTLSCVDNTSKNNDDMARKYTHSKTLSKDQLAILANTGERIDFGPVAFTVTTNALFQADGVEVYDSDCDDVPNEQPSFMANISSYGFDVLAEVHNPDNMDNNMINQGVQAMPSSEQSSVVNHLETKITSDSNIVPYSQYLHETQHAAVPNSNSSAQQDALILSVIEQLKTQVVNCTKINLDNKSINDTFTAELERYKEQVKVLKEGQNVELKSKDNVSNSCEQSVEIDRLKQTLSEHLKEKESLMQTLEPKLYDGNVIKNTHAIVISDSEETLMLAEESHSKMLLKQQDLMVLEKKVNTTPVDYAVMNQLSQDFEKRFVPHEIFQRDNSVSNQSAPSFDQYFELNELKAQSQEKDTVIKELKERIKSLCGNMNEDKVKKDIKEIETINIELDHRVSKLIAENEHLKQTYKQLYDSIKSTRVRSKEQCDALVNQVNQKSVKISDLNVSLQEKVLVITALKNELRKLKGKSVVACRESVNKPKVIAPEVHKQWLLNTAVQNPTSCIDSSIISLGLLPNPPPSTLFVPPSITYWDILFQPLFDELLNPPPSVDLPAHAVIAPITEVVAPEPAVSTGSPSSTNVEQDAPSPSNSQTISETQSPVISNDVKEDNHDLDVAHMNNDILMVSRFPENDSKHLLFRHALTQAYWIEAMQEELNEFRRLEVWELIPCLEKVMLITLKWIYKYFNPTPCVVSPMLPASAPLPADTTATSSPTTIDQDVPYASTSPTNQEIQSQVIHQGVKEQIHGHHNA
ncbi:hypothetical protein Tco_1226125 [Tanacetum coccineum]